MSKKDDIVINGKNIDEWIEESESRVLDPSVEETTLKYEKKVVAFLDLLGITHEIRSKINGEERKIISKMNKIKDLVEDEIEGSPISNNVNMLYISDSFIFVCEPQAIVSLLEMLSIIQMRVLLECQTMLRGALEYGDVNVQDNGKQIIGPAYIDAYLKQENDAIYPRIIIGNSVLCLIDGNKVPYKNIVESQDKGISLDYLQVYMTTGHFNQRDIKEKLKREGIYEYLYSFYNDFDKKDKYSVRAKYAWTINYLREKGVWSDEREYNNW